MMTSKAGAEFLLLVTTAPVVAVTRTMNLFLAASHPTPNSRREASLMVSEKAQAFVESVFEVNLALVEIGFRSATGMSRSRPGLNFLSDMDELVAASLRPYSRKVTANRSRLAKRSDVGDV